MPFFDTKGVGAGLAQMASESPPPPTTCNGDNGDKCWSDCPLYGTMLDAQKGHKALKEEPAIVATWGDESRIVPMLVCFWYFLPSEAEIDKTLSQIADGRPACPGPETRKKRGLWGLLG